MTPPPLVSVVTRAFNRLEYTIRCINSVRENTIYPNYEHIIINNASEDGTREWLDWIKNSNQPYFSRVKPIHLKQNLGDWQGMKASLQHLDPKSQYIVQLDNDIEVDKGWMTAMYGVLTKTDIGMVMCKRTRVKAKIQVNHKRELDYAGMKIKYGRVNKCVACFMAPLAKFRKFAPNIKGRGNKTILGTRMRPCGKILNIYCHHNDEYYIDENGDRQPRYLRGSTWEKL